MANEWGHYAALMKNVKDIDTDVLTQNFKDMGVQTASLLVNALGPVGALSDYQLEDAVFPDLDKKHEHC